MDIVRIAHDFLADEGYRPHIDDHGNVVVAIEGATFVVIGHENDPEFLQVLLPPFLEVDQGDIEKALFCASLASDQTKVAKLYVKGTRVLGSAEMFVSDDAAVRSHLIRLTQTLRAAVANFARSFEALTAPVPLSLN